MIINLSRIEVSVLLLHMAATRKNIQKGLKKRYEQEIVKEFMNSYDEVKTSLESIFIDDEIENKDPDEIFRFDYNVNEFKTINTFLNWYIVELEKLLSEASKLTNKKMLEEDKQQLLTLKNIKNKVEKVKKVYKIEV